MRTKPDSMILHFMWERYENENLWVWEYNKQEINNIQSVYHYNRHYNRNVSKKRFKITNAEKSCKSCPHNRLREFSTGCGICFCKISQSVFEANPNNYPDFLEIVYEKKTIKIPVKYLSWVIGGSGSGRAFRRLNLDGIKKEHP